MPTGEGSVSGAPSGGAPVLVDVLVMLVVAVASLAVLMTVTRLWTAKVQGEGWVSPVKATLATRPLQASGLPASTPKPLTMFTTPGGSRSVIRLMR